MDGQGSAEHDLPDFEIICPNLPDCNEQEYGSKNDDRNIRKIMFLVMGDEPWHLNIQSQSSARGES